jgi:hypothetical protein
MPAIDGMVCRISSNTLDARSANQAQPPASHDDRKVLPRFAGRFKRLAAKLHRAIGVGEGAGFLRESGRGQDDVGEIAGLGQEDILHHQHVQLRQGFACMTDIGIGHRRVFAHDVHAANFSRVHGIHDFHDSQPGYRIELGAPYCLEARADVPLSTRM